MTIMDALPKIRLLVPRLASDSDGEVVATVAAIIRVLKSNGADLHDMAEALGGSSNYRHNTRRDEKPKAKSKSEPSNKWKEIVDFCIENEEWLSEKERTFVTDMVGNLNKWGSPTEKQGNWLMSIFAKLGGKP